mmetsp:Transcript_65232/g.142967  ORF Transcript_65232/g.142967 Transcript_65232/m.142967 type:complete len:159 (+) Transcript_65232:218-694(+)
MSTTGNSAQDAKPCANPDCTFHGHEIYGDYCSLCFKTRKAQENEQLLQSTPAEKKEEEQLKELVEQPKVDEQSKKEASDEEKKNDETPVKRVQKNRKRCFECRKKVGYTGIECRCGFVFCGVHRYPKSHNCDFDFKAQAKKSLEAANQKVEAEKVERF